MVLRGFVGRKASTAGRTQRIFNLMARQLARLPKPLVASSASFLLQTKASSMDDSNLSPPVSSRGAQTVAATNEDETFRLSAGNFEGVTDQISNEAFGKVVDKLGALPIDGEGEVHEEHHHQRRSHLSANHCDVKDRSDVRNDTQLITGKPPGRKGHDRRGQLHKLATQSLDLKVDLHDTLIAAPSFVSSIPRSSSYAPQLPTSTMSAQRKDTALTTQSPMPSPPTPSRLTRLKGLTPISLTSLATTRSASVKSDTSDTVASASAQLLGGSEYWARRTLDEIHQLSANLNERLADFWMYRVPDGTVRIEVEGSFALEGDGDGDACSKQNGASCEWRTLLVQQLRSDVHGMYRLKVKMGSLSVFGEGLKALRCRAVLLGQQVTPQGADPQNYEKPTDWIPLALTRRLRDGSVGPKSVRLISDVDDTIRLTNVTQGLKSVFRQVFVLPHHETAVEGMSEWYNHLVSSYHVGVHFVSNAPVELWRPLRQFLQACGMPEGSHLHLKNYDSEVETGMSNAGSGNDSSGANVAAKAPQPSKTSLLSTWLLSASQRKRAAIVSILDDFPDAYFLLVGDTGELDLELYAELAKERPHQIKALYLRDVSSSPVASTMTGGPEDAKSAHLSPQIVTRVKHATKKKRTNGTGLVGSTSGSGSSSVAASPPLFGRGPEDGDRITATPATSASVDDTQPTFLHLGDPLIHTSPPSAAFPSSQQHRWGHHTNSSALQVRIAKAKSLIDSKQTELHFFRNGDAEVRSHSVRLLQQLTG